MGWNKVPTFTEVRNMTYQALLAGVKGIIFYTYADNDFEIKKHPALWAGMKTLPGEIKTLEPMLLNGILIPLKTNTEKIVAGLWQYRDRRIVCLVNTFNQPNRLSLSLPSPTDQAISLFQDRSDECSFKNGVLCGMIGPLEVHVYEIKGKE
jgi:hypothetical protein